jgi:NhaP-type Na+/H+ or K+/H+ antiporter
MRHNVTAPMAFLGAGLLASGPMRDLWNPSNEGVLVLVETTLALVLFSDAARTSPLVVERDARQLARLLLLALPIAIVVGTLGTWLLLGNQLPLVACALIAAIVVPTDAALGASIFRDPNVPIRVRRVLGAESGLNDGIATPFVLLFLAMTIDVETRTSGMLTDALVEIAIALAAAGIGGIAMGALARSARRRGWLASDAIPIVVLAAAGFCYLLAGDLGGNGFIAAYAGGLGFGWITRVEPAESFEFAERTGSAMSYVVWLLFGVYAVGPMLADTWSRHDITLIVVGMVSLLIARPAAVLLATIGSRLRLPTRLLIGWLGPRGLASVTFLLIASIDLEQAGLDQVATEVAAVATWTVLLSVVLHGASAVPLGSRYGRWAASLASVRPVPFELIDETAVRTDTHEPA